MRSIQFPKMFNTNGTIVTEASDYKAATKQNLKLLLRSEKGELFGDPYFGIRIKRYTFEQNSYILKDILIDEIYTQLALFIPQLKVERKNIEIIQDLNDIKATVHCRFRGTNLIDFSTDMYNLVIYIQEE